VHRDVASSSAPAENVEVDTNEARPWFSDPCVSCDYV
jgi:hypothetical protein